MTWNKNGRSGLCYFGIAPAITPEELKVRYNPFGTQWPEGTPVGPRGKRSRSHGYKMGWSECSQVSSDPSVPVCRPKLLKFAASRQSGTTATPSSEFRAITIAIAKITNACSSVLLMRCVTTAVWSHWWFTYIYIVTFTYRSLISQWPLYIGCHKKTDQFLLPGRKFWKVRIKQYIQHSECQGLNH